MRILLLLPLCGALLGSALAGQKSAKDAPAPAEPAAVEPTSVEPAPAAPAPIVQAPVQSWALADGTAAFLVEDHRVPLVTLRIEVPVGTEMAWAAEHHVQEAWELIAYDPDGKLRARADALAAELSVQVQENRSSLAISVLARDLDAAVVLVKDILANPDTDPDELKRQGQGRTIGWKSSLKDPDFRRDQAAAKLLFQPGDIRLAPYSEPEPVEDDAHALAATRAAMLSLPGRMVGLSGDLDRARAEAVLSSLMPPLSTSPPAISRGVLPVVGSRPPVAAEKMSPLTQIYVSMFRDGVAWTDPNYPAWKVANHVLGGHFFSRLYVALRHDGGDTYGATAGGGAGPEPGLYQLTTFTRLDNRAAIEAKLKEAVQTFQQGGITEQERLDALGFLGGRLLFAQQAPDQRLAKAMQERSYGLPAGFDEEVLKQASALSLDQINAFIRGYYDQSRFTLLTVEPG